MVVVEVSTDLDLLTRVIEGIILIPGADIAQPFIDGRERPPDRPVAAETVGMAALAGTLA